MPKYTIQLFLTSKGWQICHSDNVLDDKISVRFQRTYKDIVDVLSEKVSSRTDDPAPFKIKLQFCPSADKKTYTQGLDFKASKSCSALYRRLGMELYNILREGLMKENNND